MRIPPTPTLWKAMPFSEPGLMPFASKCIRPAWLSSALENTSKEPAPKLCWVMKTSSRFEMMLTSPPPLFVSVVTRSTVFENHEEDRPVSKRISPWIVVKLMSPVLGANTPMSLLEIKSMSPPTASDWRRKPKPSRESAALVSKTRLPVFSPIQFSPVTRKISLAASIVTWSPTEPVMMMKSPSDSGLFCSSKSFVAVMA
mmetsp:Transcript_16757/g.65460  ORF Transcript_16757/g.65460 Transcript_16757/m.65460 type:complete len:200 (-) Transcript_16757:4949-5548(-)